ncbi:MAG: hypothetical protein U0T72_02105 [Chitinophagales bacterium]
MLANKVTTIAARIFLFAAIAILLLYVHTQRKNYNRAFKEIFFVYLYIEAADADSIPSTSHLLETIQHNFPASPPRTTIKNIIQHFTFHGSSPSGFFIANKQLGFSRTLANSSNRIQFFFVKNEAGWQIDSIANADIVIEKINEHSTQLKTFSKQ